MAATILVGLLVVELERSTFRRRLIVGMGVISWVGFTRVGLAVHYPGDVAGGIAYGVAYLALFYGVRTLLTDRVGWVTDEYDHSTVAFGLAVVFGVGALYVTSGGVENYTFAHGSRNAHIVLGCAIGGLLAWTHAPRISTRVQNTTLRVISPTIGAGVVVGTWFVTDLGIGNRLFILSWSALFLTAIVLVPWFISTERSPMLS